MKQRTVFLIPCILLLFWSGKKNSGDTGIPPGDPTNMVEAGVSMIGGQEGPFKVSF